MDAAAVDQISLNFSKSGLLGLNAIGLVMHGMAIIAGRWGIWHIISGLTMALFWSRRPLAAVQEGAIP